MESTEKAALNGELILDSENPAAYTAQQMRRWKQETDEVEESLVLQTLLSIYLSEEP